MFSTKSLLGCTLVVLVGCATQPPTTQADRAGATAPSATKTGTQISGTKVTRDGCTVDLKKLCQAFIDQNEFVYNSEQYSWQRFVSNSPPHPDLLLMGAVPNGGSVGAARCHIDTAHRTITRAELEGGPEIDDKTVEYLKGRGWCEENNLDYGKLVTEISKMDLRPH